MDSKNLTFIGAGNMATCIIGGLISNGYDPAKICATDPTQEKLNQLKKTFGINITTINSEGVESADVLILAVKPTVIRKVALEIKSVINTKNPLILSIAAGVRISNLVSWFGHDKFIIRSMPNLAAMVRCGITGIYANANVPAQEKDDAESILRSVGTTLWLENEDQMDVITALSGSGIAYFFLFMEILEQEAVQQGLALETARLFTLQTALGAARVALESGQDLSHLRRQVTSPGGTTERGLRVLDQGNIRELLSSALRAGVERAKELHKMVE